MKQWIGEKGKEYIRGVVVVVVILVVVVVVDVGGRPPERRTVGREVKERRRRKGEQRGATRERWKGDEGVTAGSIHP